MLPTAYQGPEVTNVLPYRLEKAQPHTKVKVKSENETGGNSPKGKQEFQFFLFNSSENKGNIKLLDTQREGAEERQ